MNSHPASSAVVHQLDMSACAGQLVAGRKAASNHIQVRMPCRNGSKLPRRQDGKVPVVDNVDAVVCTREHAAYRLEPGTEHTAFSVAASSMSAELSYTRPVLREPLAVSDSCGPSLKGSPWLPPSSVRTSSSKNTSVCGGPPLPAAAGLTTRPVPPLGRATEHLSIPVDRGGGMHPQVSYLEIYNEQLYDLLGDSPGSSDTLAVLEDANNNTYVRGLTLVPVRSEEEALAQFFLGEGGRTTAGHVLNTESSRSHAVFTVHLEVWGGQEQPRWPHAAALTP
ncbi:Kinesin-like protein KLP1 [Tetrabaena socialis]|uniref:Kinesin-like protein KLP1 n=1 Tax=Tetrabaena socialis TaxID=47790 RepID=A0A2J8AAE6_9CHLO|nr:Kinesin-like protein KLP1 [Tetrabaena socialis]|eukprot:PNH09453.1 Kinesin-like protein KLP1 [Tetrabaena socialis]